MLSAGMTRRSSPATPGPSPATPVRPPAKLAAGCHGIVRANAAPLPRHAGATLGTVRAIPSRSTRPRGALQHRRAGPPGPLDRARRRPVVRWLPGDRPRGRGAVARAISSPSSRRAGTGRRDARAASRKSVAQKSRPFSSFSGTRCNEARAARRGDAVPSSARARRSSASPSGPSGTTPARPAARPPYRRPPRRGTPLPTRRDRASRRPRRSVGGRRRRTRKRWRSRAATSGNDCPAGRTAAMPVSAQAWRCRADATPFSSGPGPRAAPAARTPELPRRDAKGAQPNAARRATQERTWACRGRTDGERRGSVPRCRKGGIKGTDAQQ